MEKNLNINRQFTNYRFLTEVKIEFELTDVHLIGHKHYSNNKTIIMITVLKITLGMF